jgi:hypothetical protein
LTLSYKKKVLIVYKIIFRASLLIIIIQKNQNFLFEIPRLKQENLYLTLHLNV